MCTNEHHQCYEAADALLSGSSAKNASVEHSGISALYTVHLYIRARSASDDGTDRRVHAGRVAAACKYTYFLHSTTIIAHSFLTSKRKRQLI